MDINNLSYQVIGCAMKLHRNVGPGLLESAYEHALAFVLREAGFEVKQQMHYHLFTKTSNWISDTE